MQKITHLPERDWIRQKYFIYIEKKVMNSVANFSVRQQNLMPRRLVIMIIK